MNLGLNNTTYYGRPWSGMIREKFSSNDSQVNGILGNRTINMETNQSENGITLVQNLLKNPLAISSFGTELASVPSLPEYDQVTVTQFMERLNAFLRILVDSHPHKTTKKHSLMDKFFGYDLVSDSRYVVAVRKRNKVLQELLSSVTGLTETYNAMRAAREGLTARKNDLQNTIAHTQQALDHISGQADMVTADNIESIERLSKRLVDLTSVVLVMEIHENQSALVDTQLLSAIDLFYRLQDKFLPILEQHEKAIKENPKSSERMYKDFTTYVVAFSKTNANLMR